MSPVGDRKMFEGLKGVAQRFLIAFHVVAAPAFPERKRPDAVIGEI